MRVARTRPLVGVALAVGVVLAAIAVFAVATPLRSPGDTGVQPGTGESATVSDPTVNDSAVERLHAAGVTGSNVSVGVVDVTGFDADHPELADNVVAARSFAPGESVANGDLNDHGTAAASLVVRTAPDSDLYLATFDTADGYERAVGWLLDRDVDVLVVPSAFYGKPGDGRSRVATVARRATERGTVVVAPTGNLGRRHWNGQYRPVGEGVHAFEDGVRNYLRPTDGRQLRLWLSWDREHAAEDYTAELYWTNGTARRLVARSQPFPADGVPNERIVARLDDGSYYVRITGPGNATGAELTVESPTHALQFRTRSRSITAPATASRVLSVGTYDADADRVAPDSSAGPTADGRVGVDVVASDGRRAATRPDGFDGSSAAAPYVAGVVALTVDAGGPHDPAAVERAVERSALDLREPGPDPVSGHGLVRPARTVRRVRNDSNND